MDAIKFIKDRNRMCTRYTPLRCEGCPADSYGKSGEACIMIDTINPEKLVPIVEKWAIENPPRTRQSVFIEQYPQVAIYNGVIGIKPCQLVAGYSSYHCLEDSNQCVQCRKEYWLQGIE